MKGSSNAAKEIAKRDLNKNNIPDIFEDDSVMEEFVSTQAGSMDYKAMQRQKKILKFVAPWIVRMQKNTNNVSGKPGKKVQASLKRALILFFLFDALAVGLLVYFLVYRSN